MFSRIFLFFIIFFSFTTIIQANSQQLPQVEKKIIVITEKPNTQIESFFLKPEGEGPFPIVFLPVANHPKGAKALVDFGYLDRFVNLGIACVAISAPGFGASTGEKDFSGPNSVNAMIKAIDHFSSLPFIDSSRMGVYGMNRNATLASLVSAHCSALSLQILESGEYDLTSRRENLPNYLKALGLQESLLEESGGNEEALKDRSSLYQATLMHQTTLILHGEFDNHYGLPSAKALHQKLVDQGVLAYLKIYPNGLHDLGGEKWEDITPFLREHFFGLTGIGIQIAQVGPVIQISKILSGMPAALSQKLKVGDTILGIAPNNESSLIDTVKMPVKECISYILGKKGTSLRLLVQHFDYQIEEIILERGSYIF